MSNDYTEHLNSMYIHAIMLIYKSQCIWHDIDTHIDCDTALNLVRLIPEDNLHFKYDLNNGFLMCDVHKKWFEENPTEATEFLFLNYPDLANFHVLNRGASFEEQPDFEALTKVLIDSLNEAVKQGVGKFPSLYGKFTY